MKYARLYDEKDKYYTDKGVPISKQEIEDKYPGVKYVPMVCIVADENILVDMWAFNYLRDKYNAYFDTDQMELDYISSCINNEESESTPIERIASSLEYIAVLMTKEVV